MRRGVRRDVVRECGGDAPALEVDPLRVGDAVRLTHLPEGPPEPPGPRKRPIVIEEGMPQLVEDQPAQHVPRDVVATPPLAGHVAALDLDDLGRPVRDRKSTRLNSSHTVISYAVFCLKKKKLGQTTSSPCPSTPLLTRYCCWLPPTSPNERTSAVAYRGHK